jgi:hypothetical protein
MPPIKGPEGRDYVDTKVPLSQWTLRPRLGRNYGEFITQIECEQGNLDLEQATLSVGGMSRESKILQAQARKSRCLGSDGGRKFHGKVANPEYDIVK